MAKCPKKNENHCEKPCVALPGLSSAYHSHNYTGGSQWSDYTIDTIKVRNYVFNQAMNSLHGHWS